MIEFYDLGCCVDIQQNEVTKGKLKVGFLSAVDSEVVSYLLSEMGTGGMVGVPHREH